MPCCCCWFFFFFSFYNRISLDFFFDILQLILLYNKLTQGNSLLQVEQWDSISCTTKILFSRKNLMCTYRMCSQLSTPSGSPSATKNKKKTASSEITSFENRSHLMTEQDWDMKVQPSQLNPKQSWWTKLTGELHIWLAKVLSNLHWSLDSSSAQACYYPALHKCWSLLATCIINSILVFASKQPNL